MNLAPCPIIFGISLTLGKCSHIWDVPSSTIYPNRIANLKKRVQWTITIHFILQAAGFVNDHENTCDFK